MGSRIAGSAQRLFSGRLAFPADAPRPRLHLLDGARGLAAVAVLFWHYRLFFFPLGGRAPIAQVAALEPFAGPFHLLYRFGLHAVPIFWMISGFVLAFVYYGAGTSTRSFAVNRFARLYPLHLLTLLIVALLQIGARHRFGVELIYGNNDLYHFLLQLGFASDWGFQRGFSFNAPIWSVSVEVLIYAIFWLSVRWLPRWGIALPLLVSLGAAALIWSSGAPRTSPLNCAFYFFLGVTFCALYRALSVDRLFLWLAAAVLLTAGALGFGLAPTLAGQLLVGLPASVGGSMLLAVAAEPLLSARVRRICSLVGDNTYGMYLWHIPILLALFLLLAGTYDMTRLASSGWFLALFLGLVIAIARAGFVGFERPMRQWLRRLGSPPRTEGDKAAGTP